MYLKLRILLHKLLVLLNSRSIDKSMRSHAESFSRLFLAWILQRHLTARKSDLGGTTGNKHKWGLRWNGYTLVSPRAYTHTDWERDKVQVRVVDNVYSTANHQQGAHHFQGSQRQTRLNERISRKRKKTNRQSPSSSYTNLSFMKQQQWRPFIVFKRLPTEQKEFCKWKRENKEKYKTYLRMWNWNNNTTSS